MMLAWLPFVLFGTRYISFCSAQSTLTSWTTTPFNPSRLPLAVRNPYLNTWLEQGNNPRMLGDKWASFWNNFVSVSHLLWSEDKPVYYTKLTPPLDDRMVCLHCG